MKTKYLFTLLLFSLFSLTAQAQVYTKQETNTLFLPKSYTQTQAAVDQAQSDAIGLKADLTAVYPKGQTYSQQQVNDLVSPKADLTAVYPKGQTYSQQQVNDLVSPKADLTAVYPKGQTYSQQQVNDLIVSKTDFQKVPTFDGVGGAKQNITPGKPKTFLILTNELFGAPTHTVYDGTNWTHSPALIQNN